MSSDRAAAPSALLLIAALAAASPAPAQEVIAVLSSAPGPYQAAFDGFLKAFGREVPRVRLPARPPAAGARVVVAFGGEAAVQPYPADALLIACMAPGLGARLRHRGPFVFVSMKPAPGRLLSELRRLQPGLKRLAVLSDGRDTAGYIPDLRRAGAAIGVEIVSPRAAGPNGVPSALRALLAAKADAIWLAPDPSLATPENFQTIKQFSWDNRVPFYAPTRGLAVAGAAAAVSVGAEEEGRLAADLARRALAGEELPEVVYPTRTSITVNLESAKNSGLALPQNGLGKDVEALR
ncbi:MAG: hypothetical protein HYX59_11295 [Elusimicrobia bacterium]|nr:hypothetical protein [Elusimicrobiota bacterium]